MTAVYIALFVLLLILVVFPAARSRSRASDQKPPRMLTQQEFDEVVGLINRNKKVEAIARYRQLTGASLLQATEWIKTLT